LPTTETGSVLDLCSGTGVGALVAEATAERVTAVDITERCRPARFNCWLNGGRRVDIRQGDLFDPVKGERFDRILAHPPCVPALSGASSIATAERPAISCCVGSSSSCPVT
jgi:methylase of polypeptide subunit release factors